jgi:hypothetical protein
MPSRVERLAPTATSHAASTNASCSPARQLSSAVSSQTDRLRRDRPQGQPQPLGPRALGWHRSSSCEGHLRGHNRRRSTGATATPRSQLTGCWHVLQPRYGPIRHRAGEHSAGRARLVLDHRLNREVINPLNVTDTRLVLEQSRSSSTDVASDMLMASLLRL